MRKVWKVIALLACVCLVLGAFAGCSSTETPATPSASPSTSPAAAEECHCNGYERGVPAV